MDATPLTPLNMAHYALPGDLLNGGSLTLPVYVSADEGTLTYPAAVFSRYGWNGFHVPGFTAETMARIAADHAALTLSDPSFAEYGVTFTLDPATGGWSEISHQYAEDGPAAIYGATLPDGTPVFFPGNGWMWESITVNHWEIRDASGTLTGTSPDYSRAIARAAIVAGTVRAVRA